LLLLDQYRDRLFVFGIYGRSGRQAARLYWAFLSVSFLYAWKEMQLFHKHCLGTKAEAQGIRRLCELMAERDKGCKRQLAYCLDESHFGEYEGFLEAYPKLETPFTKEEKREKENKKDEAVAPDKCTGSYTQGNTRTQ